MIGDSMNNKGYFNKIFLLFFIALIFSWICIFVYKNKRDNIMLDESNIHVLLGDFIVNNNKEVTVKYDGNASKNIKEYSFDGGVTWTKSNIALIENIEDMQIVIKDVYNQLYSLEYNDNNITSKDKIKLLKINDSSDLNGIKTSKYTKYIDVMKYNSLNLTSDSSCHEIIDILDYNKNKLDENNRILRKI